jgi:hypothetical protein
LSGFGAIESIQSPHDGEQSNHLEKGLRFRHDDEDVPVMPLLAVALLALVLVVAFTKPRAEGPTPAVDGEALIHRCDFCKEAILLIDDEAKCFVRHAGRRPLLGYSVVNACGACVRERNVDGAFSSESADPSA